MQSKFLFTFTLICCAVFSARSQSPFDWLIGKWKQKKRDSYEVWTRGSGNVLLNGVVYKITSSRDTVFTEEIKFHIKDDKYYYIPDVAGDKGPIPFTVSHFDETGFVAENPDHDFPKKIAYRYTKKENRLIATISGDGKSIEFHFEKIN